MMWALLLNNAQSLPGQNQSDFANHTATGLEWRTGVAELSPIQIDRRSYDQRHAN
jgi:hypothetical protein